MPDGSPVPYLIIGATWKRAADDDYEAPVKMFMPPEKYWTSRYYQGTDPIQSSSGFSKFASVIWDRVGYMKEEMIGGALQRTMNPTIACILNDRRVNVKECFIQSKLMGMFYANLDQKACKECHEVNQGQEYEAFICSPWLNLKESLWHKAVLPSKYTKGQGLYGVDLKEGRKNALHYDLVRLLSEDGRNIWYYDIWSQVRNIDVVEDAKGNVIWGTMNKNLYNDDMVIALGYAEISSRADRREPQRVTPDNPQYKMRKKVIRINEHGQQNRPDSIYVSYETVREKVKYA
jgi:hypothetical protein